MVTYPVEDITSPLIVIFEPSVKIFCLYVNELLRSFMVTTSLVDIKKSYLVISDDMRALLVINCVESSSTKLL